MGNLFWLILEMHPRYTGEGLGTPNVSTTRNSKNQMRQVSRNSNQITRELATHNRKGGRSNTRASGPATKLEGATTKSTSRTTVAKAKAPIRSNIRRNRTKVVESSSKPPLRKLAQPPSHTSGQSHSDEDPHANGENIQRILYLIDKCIRETRPENIARALPATSTVQNMAVSRPASPTIAEPLRGPTNRECSLHLRQRPHVLTDCYSRGYQYRRESNPSTYKRDQPNGSPSRHQGRY